MMMRWQGYFVGLVISGIFTGTELSATAETSATPIIQHQISEIGNLNNESEMLSIKKKKDSLIAEIAQFEIDLKLSRAVGDLSKEAQILHNIGGVYSALKDNQKALDYYNQALVVFHAMSNSSDKKLRQYPREAATLNNIGIIYSAIGENRKALEYYNQALSIWRAMREQSMEAVTLSNIADVYNDIGEKKKALEYYTKALPLWRVMGNSPVQNLRQRSSEAATFNNIGIIYSALGAKRKALEYYNQALPIYHSIADRSGAATTLGNIGSVHSDLGERQKALKYYNQALSMRLAAGDHSGTAKTLNNIGTVYAAIGEKQKALEYYNQALPILRAGGDHFSEAMTLLNIGVVYSDLGEKQKALNYYNQALNYYSQVLPIVRVGLAQSGKAMILDGIGGVYSDLGEKQKALNYYNQALPIVQAVGDPSGEAQILNNIGLIYSDLGEKQKALDYYNQALPLMRVADNRSLEARTFINIGSIYSDLGEKQKALDYYNQALSLMRVVGDRSGEAAALNGIGLIYSDLGEKQKALDYYNQALPIFRAVGNRSGEAGTLTNIGGVYSALGEKQKALNYFNQALSLMRVVGDRSGEATDLNGIGLIYRDLGEKQKALDYFNQALPIFRAVGNRSGEAGTLNNIGGVYSDLGENQKALNYYNQALPLNYAVGRLTGEAVTLHNMSNSFYEQKQSEMSIVFLKQSVAAYERLRSFIQKLPPEQQASYTRSIASTYRVLTELLLQQNRTMEAFQVLDLLKAQELRQYLPDRSPNSAPTPGIDLLPQEQTFWDRYKAIMQPAIDQSTEFNDLTRLTQPTPQQTQRLNELKRIQDQIPEQLDQYRNSSEANQLFNQLKNTAAQQHLSLPIYKTFQTKVNALSQNAALFYPLVLDDRLELVILIPGKVLIRHTVNVTKAQLEAQIKIFRQQIGDADPNGIPKNDIAAVKQSAQQIYNWLIQPIAAELQAANIQTILYAPDGQLRYIPLAALYDGKAWLTQKYQINHLTALALTPIDPASSAPPRTLAAAFTQGTYSFTIPTITAEPQSDGTTRSRNTTESIDFSGLSHSRGEVENLSQILKIKPDDKLFDQAFSKAAITSRLPNYNILHLATHGIFIPDKPEESFIVMGNGEKLRLTDIKGWNFPNLQFVMLSACETGQGQQLSNGIEVLGFGYQLQQAKVRASMSSLWKVHDAGTRLLSQQFYEQAYGQNLRKTAALQKVQQDFIAGKMDVEMSKLRSMGACIGNNCFKPSDRPTPTTIDATHPYYWAPFIIVGNGL
jgi:CHAT domain-containing protein/Tfp pilus assembly protein PilF